VMELGRETSQGIVGVAHPRVGCLKAAVARHWLGACMTLPQAVQVRCEMLE
jgi:hypothetical protein